MLCLADPSDKEESTAQIQIAGKGDSKITPPKLKITAFGNISLVLKLVFDRCFARKVIYIS
jgi:hypothetical protein